MAVEDEAGAGGNDAGAGGGEPGGPRPQKRPTMTARPKAIDIMYYVATPEFIAKWTDAKKGELICSMERAIGSLPQFESIPRMLQAMDAAGGGKGFIQQT